LANKKKETRCKECDSILEDKICPTPELHEDYLIKLSEKVYNTIEITKRDPLINLYDVETAPDLAWVYGKKYEPNIIDYEEYGFLMSVSWTSWKSGKYNCVALPDFDLYKTEPRNDYALCKFIAEEIINPADGLVGHNSIGFDNKVVNQRLKVHGLPTLLPRKDIDTLKVARKEWKLPSNTLDEIAHYFKLGRKLTHTPGMQLRCIREGTEEHWNHLKEYNIQDVVLLEEVFNLALPYFNTLSMNILNGDYGSCAFCGESGFMNKVEGKFKYNKVSKLQIFKCLNCGGNNTGRSLTTLPVTYKSI